MNELPYPLWTADPEAALLASRDRTSGVWIFPAVPAESPLAERYETRAVAPVGALYGYTVIHPSAKSGEAPYALGYVDFPGPVRIFGRVHGAGRPVIGDRCAARRHDQFGYVFDTIAA